MKTNSRRHSLSFAILLTASALCALTSFAQPAPEGKPENRPPGGRQPQFRERMQGMIQRDGPGGGQFMPMVQRVLTEEQRTSLRSAMEAQREKSRELEEKMRDARRELLKASVLDKFAEDAVRSKALEVAKLEAELTVLRAKAFSEMKPALSQEQIEELKNPPPMEGAGNRGENFPAPNRRGVRDAYDLPVTPPKR